MGKEKPNKVRQYRGNQGRSPKRMESSYKIMAISMLGIVVSILVLVIQNWINA